MNRHDDTATADIKTEVTRDIPTLPGDTKTRTNRVSTGRPSDT